MSNKTESLLDRGLSYGEACFETFRVVGGQIFRWPDHLARLRLGLGQFGIELPDDPLPQVVTAAASVGPDALVRLTVSGGEAAWGLKRPVGLKPALHIQVTPFTAAQQPLRVATPCWPFPLLPRPAKFTSDYALTLRALHQLNLPAGVEPLVADERHLWSGTTGNLWIFREGYWWTPPVLPGVLPGVVRHHLLEFCPLCRESLIPRHWLPDATAACLTNSGRFIWPIGEVDGKPLNCSPHQFAPLWSVIGG